MPHLLALLALLALSSHALCKLVTDSTTYPPGGASASTLSLTIDDTPLIFPLFSPCGRRMTPLLLLANLTLVGPDVFTAIVSIGAGVDQSTDRLGISGEGANTTSLASPSCPPLVVSEFATMGESGLILSGPAPSSVFEACLRRVTFDVIRVGEDGSISAPMPGPRNISFESFAGPNGEGMVSGSVEVDVVLGSGDDAVVCDEGDGLVV
jgi:hypothetical protein